MHGKVVEIGRSKGPEQAAPEKAKPLLPDPRQRPFIPAWTDDESEPCAARFLGLGRSSVYEAIQRGEVPAVRIARRLVIPVASLWRLADIDLPPDP